MALPVVDAMTRHAMTCCAMPCRAIPWRTIPRHSTIAVLCADVLCHGTLRMAWYGGCDMVCRAVNCHAMPSSVMPWRAMLRRAMACCTMPCRPMPCLCAMAFDSVARSACLCAYVPANSTAPRCMPFREIGSVVSSVFVNVISLVQSWFVIDDELSSSSTTSALDDRLHPVLIGCVGAGVVLSLQMYLPRLAEILRRSSKWST